MTECLFTTRVIQTTAGEEYHAFCLTHQCIHPMPAATDTDMPVPGAASMHGTLGQAIRFLRQRARLSQAAFAAEFGRTQTWCSYVEGGRRVPNLTDLQRMSVRYGLALRRGYWTVE